MKLVWISFVSVLVALFALAVCTYFFAPPLVQVAEIAVTTEPSVLNIAIPQETAIATAMAVVSEQIEAPEIVLTQTLVAIPTQTATPESELVSEYILNEKINLSEGMIALNIRLDDQKILPGNWAEATSNQFVDRDSEFDPHNGTIYTVLGDTTVIGAHSGTIYGSPILFASNIDLYLRRDGQKVFGLDEGLANTAGLIGKTAFFCQTTVDMAKKLRQYDPSAPCVGVQQELMIVAVGLVQEPLVEEYGQHLTSLRSFMIANAPEANFELLNPKTGFVLITCVGRYPDQPVLSGIPDYEYNRLVIGFEVVR